MLHRQKAPDRTAGTGFSRAHNPEAIARAKGAGTGAGAGGKSNLAGQIIPVYGFGILLYILYILFKVERPSRRMSLSCKTLFAASKCCCVFCRSHLRGTASRQSADLPQFALKTWRGRSVSIRLQQLALALAHTQSQKCLLLTPTPTQPTLSWLSCRRSWEKQSWWWRTSFPTRTTVLTGGWIYSVMSPPDSALSWQVVVVRWRVSVCRVCLCFRVKGVTADQEASLLQQLTEITRVMQERHLVEEAAPEKKSWEGRHTPEHSISRSQKQRFTASVLNCLQIILRIHKRTGRSLTTAALTGRWRQRRRLRGHKLEKLTQKSFLKMFQRWKFPTERVKRTRHQRTMWVWPNERREVTGSTWESRRRSCPESWNSWSSHSPWHPCWRRRRWAASQGWQGTSAASDAGRGGRWRKCRTDFLHRLNRFLFIWTRGNMYTV